ncbi:hypothetical protein BD770DRAFT_404962, partial [Pilaira anomala]
MFLFRCIISNSVLYFFFQMYNVSFFFKDIIFFIGVLKTVFLALFYFLVHSSLFYH